MHGFHPANGRTIPNCLNTYIAEWTAGAGSEPVALIRTEPDAVSRSHLNDGASLALNETDAIQHEQHLPAWMAMPMGNDARIDIDAHRGHLPIHLARDDRLYQERTACHAGGSRRDPITGSPDRHRGWTGDDAGLGGAHSIAPIGFAAQTPEANDQSASVASAMTIMTSSGRMPTVPARSSASRL